MPGRVAGPENSRLLTSHMKEGAEPFRGLTCHKRVRILSDVRFIDRVEAGIALANALELHRSSDSIVFAIPRGGVIIGAQVARRLGLHLEAIVACKVPAPGHPELGIGAVAEGDVRHVDMGLASVLKIAPGELHSAVHTAEDELRRRVLEYRRARPLPDLRGRAAILVDDGIARGVTARAAIEALRKLGPARLVVAAPVASAFAADSLAGLADAVVALARPAVLRSVSEWYDDFRPIRDADVVAWLEAVGPGSSGEHAVA